MLDRKQWFLLLALAAGIGLTSWVVTGLHWGFAYRVLLRLGAPLNAIALMMLPVAGAVALVGRQMKLENWRQWSLLSATALFHSFIWVAFENNIGRHVAISFAEFMDERSTQSAVAPSDILVLGLLLGLSLVVCGIFLGLVFPPGIWRRIQKHISTPERRQLAILLCASAWVTLMVVLVGGARNALTDVALSSLPVLMFAGVLVWWLGQRSKDDS